MDPICHTLVGTSLSFAGFRRWTPRATALLVLAANAPDIDIVAAVAGRNLEWRRGLTHGVPALLVWPFLLAALAAWWERRQGGAPRFWRLAVMAAVGVVSHPFLDYLNNYGLRWFMPIVDRWYYGDTLFIVDPWLYLALGAGTWLSARRWRQGRLDAAQPAVAALAVAAIYIGAMMAGTQWGRQVAAGALQVQADAPGLMVAPVPVDPLIRSFVLDDGDHYRTGRLSLVTRQLSEGPTVPKGEGLAGALAQLRRTREGAAFVHWSRIPALLRDPARGTARVFDLRYSNGTSPDCSRPRCGPGWAALDLTEPPSESH